MLKSDHNTLNITELYKYLKYSKKYLFLETDQQSKDVFLWTVWRFPIRLLILNCLVGYINPEWHYTRMTQIHIL